MSKEWQEYSAKRRTEYEALRNELIAVLDVAIARGEQLGYEDADYCARYLALTGNEWSDVDAPPQVQEES